MQARFDSRQTYRFGIFELDTRRFEFRREGVPIKLEKLPMELLILLVERRGELVSRQEIVERLWGDNVYVDAENGINTAVRKIRVAMGDSIDHAGDPIQTVVGKGYRISLPVVEVAADSKERRRSSRLIALFVMMGLLAIVGVAIYSQSHAQAPITSIAVLPLDNFSADPKQDYFADGITDAIITRVAQSGGFKVISRSSVMRFKGRQTLDLRKIARELNVDAVVEGSVIRDKSRVRITAQLIDARTDRHLWAEQYDRESSEILQLQDEIARRIARSVQATIGSTKPPQVAQQHEVNPEAYDDYLRARAFSQQRTPASLAQAIDLYQLALNLEPRFAEAYAGMADAYAALGYNSFVSPQESFPKSKAAALKALEFDPASAEAHAALGYALFYYDWNTSAAQKEFDEALKTNPNHAVTHHWRSVLLTSQSRYDEAQREIALARTLDPLSLPIDADVGFELYYAGRYEDAIQHLTSLTTASPNFPPPHLWLGRAYEQKRMYAQSITELERADQLVPDWSVIIAALGHARGVSGDKAGAQRELVRLASLSKTRFVTPYGVALIYAGLDDRKNAMVWLNRAYREKSHWLVWLRTDPRFSNLKAMEDFENLVRKVGS
jgi:TolB-like protein/DNA-binding winged helix-turn-helix (wHTH) protein/Tfp pilus assembly protein PilF